MIKILNFFPENCCLYRYNKIFITLFDSRDLVLFQQLIEILRKIGQSLIDLLDFTNCLLLISVLMLTEAILWIS
jgi:hypothetical protein